MRPIRVWGQWLQPCSLAVLFFRPAEALGSEAKHVTGTKTNLSFHLAHQDDKEKQTKFTESSKHRTRQPEPEEGQPM